MRYINLRFTCLLTYLLNAEFLFVCVLLRSVLTNVPQTRVLQGHS